MYKQLEFPFVQEIEMRQIVNKIYERIAWNVILEELIKIELETEIRSLCLHDIFFLDKSVKTV